MEYKIDVYKRQPLERLSNRFLDFLRACIEPKQLYKKSVSYTHLWRHSQVATARVCKTLIPGSNPGVASNLNKFRRLLQSVIISQITKFTENTVFESSILFLYLIHSVIEYHRRCNKIAVIFWRNNYGIYKKYTLNHIQLLLKILLFQFFIIQMMFMLLT